MKFLGIDYGTKKVGLALSSDDGVMAFPHGVWPNDRGLLRRVGNLIKAKGIKTVVIGESLDFQMRENPVMAEIKRFKEKLEKELNILVELEPEYMTTHQVVKEQGRNKKKDMTDAASAALILQSYIDKRAKGSR